MADQVRSGGQCGPHRSRVADRGAGEIRRPHARPPQPLHERAAVRALEAGGSLTVIATIDNQETGFAGAIREELIDIATGVVNL